MAKQRNGKNLHVSNRQPRVGGEYAETLSAQKSIETPSTVRAAGVGLPVVKMSRAGMTFYEIPLGGARGKGKVAVAAR